MNRSLQLRLILMLGGAILLAALVAGLAAFVLAYLEAAEMQDDLLRQVAALADRHDALKSSQHDSARASLADDESRISLIRLPGDPRPAWLPEHLASGFHQLEAEGEPLRVFVREDVHLGLRVIVAQPTETRDEIALASALHTLVPLLLVLPVMGWLIVRVVRHTLAPIADLARYIDAQPADRPSPMSKDQVPDEIRPFIQAINRLLERVADLIQQQRRFIADAAHEIRSPLTALSVQAENLSQAQTLEAVQERLQPLQAGIERARKLTEQLLSLARLQSGTQAAQDVDLAVLARELIAESWPLAEAKGIDLGLEERASVRLSAPPESLRLVLRNGLDNALKYGRDGGEVTLSINADSGYVTIEILDDGPGIPAEERTRVLEPFLRLQQGHTDGSGLGLSIAREAAARLGGVLELDARADGPGLTFRYRQPLGR
ncbi:two-component sensor histidine kinase [Thiorhodococcus mannitoliphagus]|uniref:histidine kinase n=1 Tax=Thiorhodococcus mannitoliphagus TaxID=329406 RepID=A0A6P1E176_9GAMM|nr:ATP-binding protein [Thiorhodococcus mannitoliphagus]NEX21485.1 two-component sensor histidine kinase [Thiorhodococcus mannitoliphagus]